MSRSAEPKPPADIRLRREKFEAYCAELHLHTDLARSRHIGISRAQINRVRANSLPGNSFIAATLLAFASKNTTPGAVFDDLFEVIPPASRRDLPAAA
jgi:hypothetical protein